VRFAFSEDQLLFRDTVRDLLDKEVQPEQVRFAWVDDDGRLVEVWHALAEMGVIGVQVPTDHGGLGLDERDLVLLLEEAGRVALPDPLVETAAVAAPLLAEVAGSAGAGPGAELAATWLPRIAAGDAVVALALDPGQPVSHGADAELLVGRRDDRLVAVPGDRVAAVAQSSVDGARCVSLVDWSSADEVELATGSTARDLEAAARDRAAMATASVLIGLGARMLELTVAYVKERRQFGVPVGSFQAVKHHLADAALRLEFARPVVHAAAWSLATGQPDASRAASHAKVAASDAASFAGRQALQCHGAIGYTVDYDLHLWLKRVWALSAAWGGPLEHRRKVADAVLGPYPSSLVDDPTP
jgi:alkylation response protein AidB-like acyl-CoA dehydrogenase